MVIYLVDLMAFWIHYGFPVFDMCAYVKMNLDGYKYKLFPWRYRFRCSTQSTGT